MKTQELLQPLETTLKDSQIFSQLINSLKPVLICYETNQVAEHSEVEALSNAALQQFSALVRNSVGKEDFAADDVVPCFEKELSRLKISYRTLGQLRLIISDLVSFMEDEKEKLNTISSNSSTIHYYLNSLLSLINFKVQEKILNDLKNSIKNKQAALNIAFGEIKSISLSEQEALNTLIQDNLLKLSEKELLSVFIHENEKLLTKNIVNQTAYLLSLAKPESEKDYIKLLAYLDLVLGKESNVILALEREIDDKNTLASLKKEVKEFYDKPRHAEGLVDAIIALYDNGKGVPYSKVLGELPEIETVEYLLKVFPETRMNDTNYLYSWLNSKLPDHKIIDARSKIAVEMFKDDEQLTDENYQKFIKRISEIKTYNWSRMSGNFISKLPATLNGLRNLSVSSASSFSDVAAIDTLTSSDIHDYLHFAAIAPKRISLVGSALHIVKRAEKHQIHLSSKEVKTIASHSIKDDDPKFASKLLMPGLLKRLMSRLSGKKLPYENLEGAELHSLLLEMQDKLKIRPNYERLNDLVEAILRKKSYRKKLFDFYVRTEGNPIALIENIHMKDLLKSRKGIIFEAQDELSGLYNQRISAVQVEGHHASTAILQNVSAPELDESEKAKVQLAEEIYKQINIEILPIANKKIATLSRDEQDGLEKYISGLLNHPENAVNLEKLKEYFPLVKEIAAKILIEKNKIDNKVVVIESAASEIVKSSAADKDNKTEISVH